MTPVLLPLDLADWAAAAVGGSMVLAIPVALLAGLDHRLLLLDRAGHPLWSHALDRPPAAVALGALGERAVLALADGRLLDFDLRDAVPSLRRTSVEK